MNRREGLPAKKYGPYVQEHLIEAVDVASGGNPSKLVPVALLGWLALADHAITVRGSAMLQELVNEPDINKAKARAWAVIKEEVRDAILKDHARSLPKSEQARIIQRSLGAETKRSGT